MSECRRWHVSGRVQGVFFRDSTRRQAEALGLTGHALNLDDGRVEVLACGPSDALDRLHEWLREGSPNARVTDLQSETVDVDAPERFTTG